MALVDGHSFLEDHPSRSGSRPMTEEATGAWIFVSHSHGDLEKVRRVRNALEERGHNPLLFFLKCLGDDSEVDALIRREIEARTHFILCDSPNARKSRWVQAEADIIKGLPDREYDVVDLTDPWDVQLQRIHGVAQRATVTVSYSPADATVAEAIARALRNQDYAVFLDPLTPAALGESRTSGRNRTLQDSMERGWIFLLLSPALVTAEMVIKKDVFAALGLSARGTTIIPVLVEEREQTLRELRSWPDFGFGYALEHVQITDLTKGNLAEGISHLIRSLKSRPRQ